MDYLVVDHLAGPVPSAATGRTIEVFSDPLDPALSRAEEEGRLIWGWSEADLARWNEELEVRREHTVPFSVASERMEAMAQGTDVTITVARHPEAEAAIATGPRGPPTPARVGPRPDEPARRTWSVGGLAPSHDADLAALHAEPIRPVRGLPPWAARATATFESELSAWARTLTGEHGEYATILASDIADLRAALDRGNPFEEALSEASRAAPKTLVVTRTRTASRALLDFAGRRPRRRRDREPHGLPDRTSAPRGDVVPRAS